MYGNELEFVDLLTDYHLLKKDFYIELVTSQISELHVSFHLPSFHSRIRNKIWSVLIRRNFYSKTIPVSEFHASFTSTLEFEW